MKGLFWNIRGMGLPGRFPTVVSKIRENHVDFVGIIETKKEVFTPGYLRNLTGNTPFSWEFVKANGSAGGLLVGANSDIFTLSTCLTFKYAISVVLTNKVSGFSFKWVTVYGSPYENGKQEFLDELENIMGAWQGPMIIGGDFNLVRSVADKSNGVINYK